MSEKKRLTFGEVKSAYESFREAVRTLERDAGVMAPDQIEHARLCGLKGVELLGSAPDCPSASTETPKAEAPKKAAPRGRAKKKGEPSAA